MHLVKTQVAGQWVIVEETKVMLESVEVASAEEITQCSAVEEEPAYGKCEATQYAHRERERHEEV